MADDTVTTTVDGLIELLKTVDKIKVEDVAKKLNLSEEVVQSWVDFLSEENIVGTEYKFTTPYIYLNKEKDNAKKKRQKEIKAQDEELKKIQDEFHQRAAEKRKSKHKRGDLWQNHLLSKLDSKKDFFFAEARKRSLFNPQELWEEYREKMVNLNGF